MKFTLLVTQRCNLSCTYCYIGQRRSRMSLEVAAKIIELAYRTTPSDEKLEIGFFGGEPLLEFEVVREIVGLVEAHPHFDRNRVHMTVITNGTIFSSRIAKFLTRHEIALGISCDGPPDVQDRCRRFGNGRRSSTRVETNIQRALESLPSVMVNAVYTPETLRDLPRTVDYLSALGIRQIYLTPDLTADWTRALIESLSEIYDAVGYRYADYYLEGDPHFLSLIDSKIAVILRGGYHALERCRMGRGELAFTPEGRIYPCERLVGDGTDGHSIGDLDGGIRIENMLCRCSPGEPLNTECQGCSLKDYCMHWCGCSNFFASGFYNRVSSFQCASEKASIRAAFAVFRSLEQRMEGAFCEHLSGRPQSNSLLCRAGSLPLVSDGGSRPGGCSTP